METKYFKKQKNQKQTNKQKGFIMNRNLFALLGVLCILVLLIPITVFATGTPAGTIIKNIATATYNDAGGNAMPSVKDSVLTTVEQIAGIALTPLSYSKIVGDSTNTDIAFRLNNMGNGTDNFNLAVQDSASWTHVFYADADSNGAPDNLTPVTSVSNLVADGKYYFVLRVFAPDKTPNTTRDTLLVTATSVYGQSNAPAAVAYSHDTLMVERVDYNNAKTNKTSSNMTPKPEDVITYKVTFFNSGSSNAKTVTLTDALPSFVTYSGSTPITPDSGNGLVNFAGSTFTWNPSSVLPGRGIGFHFDASVNSNLPAGTLITNTASVVYVDSISGRSKRDTTYITITVKDSLGWVLKVDVPTGGFAANNSKDSVNVGTNEYFVLKLLNRGNRTDTLANIFKSTSLPLGWTVYADLNKNGTYESGTDSICSTFASTGPVAQNSSVWYLVKATPANTLADRSRDSAYYRFKSTWRTDSAWGYTITLVKAPLLKITKYVTAVNGHTRPGDTLLYTVKYVNLGSGTAKAVVITDASPTNTSYITSSVSVAPADSTTWTTKTDVAADDEVTVSSGTVVYSVAGDITPGAYCIPDTHYKGFMRFKVKIQ